MTTSPEIVLPPLPVPMYTIPQGWDGSIDGFTAAQMKAFANAAVRADRASVADRGVQAVPGEPVAPPHAWSAWGEAINGASIQVTDSPSLVISKLRESFARLAASVASPAAPESPVVPPIWKLVPLEPNAAMEEAGEAAFFACPQRSRAHWAAICGDAYRAMLAAAPASPVVPIDMVLFCPACGLQHIDEPEEGVGVALKGGELFWDNPPHRSHLCHGCGHVWRPADVPTNGVAAVKTKGEKDGPATPASIRQGWDVEDLLSKRAPVVQVPGEPVAWQVWWGLIEMQPHWPPFKSRIEAYAHASSIKSNTEVRPLYAASVASPAAPASPSVAQAEPSERDASPVASDRAFSYALGLATTLWARYYKAKSPNWQPLEDTLGLLTQIDNMIAGIPAYARVSSLVAEEDTQRLDWLEKRRVSIIPEFEGPWDATIYDDEGEPQSVASGNTPRAAIDAARASAGEAQC